MLHADHAARFSFPLLCEYFFTNDNIWTTFLQVKSSYYLVSLVDNDYIHSDLFAVFKDLWDL